MKSMIFTIMLGCVFWLAACDSDAGNDMEKEFEKALQEVTELACYNGKSMMSGIIVTTQSDGDVKLFVQSHEDALYGDLQDSLMENGFIGSQPEKLRVNFRNTTVFPITDNGLEYLSLDEGVCVGNFVFANIEKFTEPATENGVVATQVSYKTKFVPYEWFDNAGMPGGIPEPYVENYISGREVDEDGMLTKVAIFQKMNKGWKRVDVF